MTGKSNYKNIFATKSEMELMELYKQFLEFEETGRIPEGTELEDIFGKYREWFKPDAAHIMQLDILRAAAAHWYESMLG